MKRDNPFKEALKLALEPVKISLHVPGHKYGHAQLRAGYGDEPHFRWDTTEIPGTDNLHDPEGAIRDAQLRASRFYGSKETFFLVNGTTSGVLAMILAAVGPGETLLMGRDCHQSAYHGAYLAQARLRWLEPEFDPVTLLNLGIRREQVERHLKSDPSIRAVVITYPTYFGLCSDLAGIADLCRRYGVLLLVDEAHGAHLKLSKALPLSSLSAGADICVQSTHKTLPALTQSAMLHVGSGRVDLEKLRWMLRMVQSSSPSYLLMQSLDQAVTMAEETGTLEMERLLSAIRKLHDALSGVPGLVVQGRELMGRGGVCDADPTKIILNPSVIGMSGPSLSERLRTDFGIQVELSTPWLALGIASVGNSDADIAGLAAALLEISSSPKDASPVSAGHRPPPLPEMVMGWREALEAKKRSVPVAACGGLTAGVMVTPYPPGIPVLMPGERISEETVAYLMTCRREGISVIGLQGAESDSIQVVKS